MYADQISPHKNLNSHSRLIFGLSAVPAGWTRYVHLDGKPYFHNESWRVVTEANILNSTILDQINTLHGDLSDALSKATFKLPNEYEIYLTVSPDQYYIADHWRRKLFWVEDIGLEELDPDFYDSPCKSIGE
jgi:hypothetical protein